MLKMKIRTRNGEYLAELDDGSDISNAVWFSLPYSSDINMLGDSIYFELPEMTIDVKGERKNVFEQGDIAYWPGVNAIVIMFGPTPLSGEDGKPVTKHKCIKFGHIVGECSSMEDAGDRQKITLLKGE